MSRSKKPTLVPEYVLYDSPLSTTTKYKYLGVTTNDTLTWNDHEDAIIISQANKTLGFIWHVADGTTTDALAFLTRHLSYQSSNTACQHGPIYLCFSSKIEKIQRRTSRMCLKRRRGTMDHKDRLHSLGWTSLDSRRQRLTVIFVIKGLFGTVDCCSVRDNTQVIPRQLDSLTSTVQAVAG